MDKKFFYALSPREQKVLEMRSKGVSYKEIAEEFCVTRERVRQVQAKALRKIRDARQHARLG